MKKISVIFQNCRLITGKRYFSSTRCRRVNSFEMSTLETLQFDNLALKCLPMDPEERNYVRTVNGACFSKVQPTPLENPVLIAYSKNAMSLLGLIVDENVSKELTKYFSGNQLLPGSEPAAHCYCGHQFGYFSGQLGDGAAMYLGEILNKKGERWEIQLKGAGLTPYSRTADGRKVMRSTIREFLCSEAIHFLGIPTARAGVCITSDSTVIRDVFYDGNPIKEKCSVVLRIAPTFLRFGSFEIFKTMDPVSMRVGPSVGRWDILKQLLEYTIKTFYPQLFDVEYANEEAKYAAFFNEVVLRTARLVAKWQCVGFCHGVLNTDNMSIVGLTLDYGPFGFMDMYNPDFICNSSDNDGRYSYSRQPEMCLWNLRKLAEALVKVLPLNVSNPVLDHFEIEYNTCYLNGMRQKLGLTEKHLEDDKTLIEKLFFLMEETGADFTNTFRCFSLLDLPALPTHASSLEILLKKLLQQCYPASTIAKSLKSGSDARNIQMLRLLVRTNPAFAERLNQAGIDLNRMQANLDKAELYEKMSSKDKKKQDESLWKDWLALYVQRLEKETGGCTSQSALHEIQLKRVNIMNNTNPRFILRNYIAQNAIDKAEKGDFTEVQRILKLLEKPFDIAANLDGLDEERASTSKDTDGHSCLGATYVRYIETLSPDWASGLRVT